MDTAILIVGVVSVRILISFMEKFLARGARCWWGMILFAATLSAIAPLILIEEGVLSESALNVILAGFIFFYFPFVAGRISRKES